MRRSSWPRRFCWRRARRGRTGLQLRSVAVDDLYAVAERHLDCQTDGCHFNAKGYDLLAEAVAESVLPRR